MSKLFLWLYNRLEHRRRLLYLCLVMWLGLCALGLSQLRLDENISSFFDDGTHRPERRALFAKLRIKDKLVVQITGEEPDAMVEAAACFVEAVDPLLEEGLIRSVTQGIDGELMVRTTDFIYRHLPIFLEEQDFEDLDSLLQPERIREAVARSYERLTSVSGFAVGEVVMRDPLDIGTHLVQRFSRFEGGFDYELYDGRLFTSDYSMLVMFIDPAYGMGSTGDNERLVAALEAAASSVQQQVEGVEVTCIGGPVVAVHNARRIKADTTLTLSLALLVIVAVIGCSFRSRRAIPLMVLPPAFGALSALAFIGVVKGLISAIAIGAGAVVLGIALSYSIHVIAHLNHTTDPRQLIRDLAEPLTVGCLTTIGAFLALLFTQSVLLRDLGLFSALTLVGTTLFCLIVLPHLLDGMRQQAPTRLLQLIERGNGYSYERNRPIVLLIVGALLVGLCFYDEVRFDDDMSHINYVPKHIEQAEAKLTHHFADEKRSVYLVSVGEDFTTTTTAYERLGRLCDSLHQAGVVESFVSAADFVIAPEVQQQRLERWHRFWEAHRAKVIEEIDRCAVATGFREGAFHTFAQLVTEPRSACGFSDEELDGVPLLADWIGSTGTTPMLVSRITLPEEQKPAVYAQIEALGGTAIIDRAYFSSKMVTTAGDDFNYILWVSSLLVFVALILSYGRIELALLTFLPMCISWVMILGLMALCDIRFNIVNVILATFIFGIGDDFSIFIMDGLLQEYRTGERMIGVHKTAIFFSAFTTLVGMGVLLLAEHPALRSMALISVLGLCVVVLVSYTVQPFLFRWLVTAQTERGGYPYTLLTLLNTLYCFLYFLLGCLIAQLYMAVLWLLPVSRRWKRDSFHRLLYRFTRLFLSTMVTVRTCRPNPYGEDYSRPAVIIANHQSFIDILLMLSTSPKIVMVTNSWVWHSPFFGRIVRYADGFHTADGHEALVEQLRPRVEEGYSVVIFPEGTRSVDGSIGRFHKGAFYLAEALGLDILPMVLYGTGQISSKRQGFYIKRGVVVAKTLQRVSASDSRFGETPREKAKAWRRWFREAYQAMNEEYGRTSNPYFRDAVVKNYIYKGPILEWYMRVKMRIDGYYALWDRLIPRSAKVTDVGCGYGQMAFMLAQLSPEREVTGIDYDERKITLAKHSFLCNERMRFVCADMRTTELPISDVFLFNDSLHYISAAEQEQLLTRAVNLLPADGMLIVRDGDASDQEGQQAINRTERWSTEILRFNKTSRPLEFVGRERMEAFAVQHGLHLRIERCDRMSSETLYVFKKPIADETV